jgi:hypothetical protein
MALVIPGNGCRTLSAQFIRPAGSAGQWIASAEGLRRLLKSRGGSSL